MASFLLAFLVLAGFGPWEAMGPEGGEITALAHCTQNSSHLYAVSGSNPTTVLRSQDAGASWENIGSFTGSTVYDLTMTASGTLVAFGGHRVWRSTDGGFNWTIVSVTNTYFHAGAAHPTDGNRVYSAAYRWIDSYWRIAFMKSVDGGQSWTHTQISTENVHAYGRSIAVSQSNPDVILLGGQKSSGGYAHRVYISEDGGDSFTDITPFTGSNESFVYGVAIHPTDPDILLAGTNTSVYRSTDRGGSWIKTATQSRNYRIMYSHLDPNLVFSGGYSSIYRSTNGGVTWSTVSSGLTGINFQHVIPSRSVESQAYTGSSAGFFRSTNSGSSWTASNDGLLAGKVLVACRADGYIYIQLSSLGLFRTPEGYPADWTPVNQASGCGDLAGLVSDGNLLLLALEAGG